MRSSLPRLLPPSSRALIRVQGRGRDHDRGLQTMHITIVGAGNVGRALAGAWRKAGHEVTLALRDPAGGKAAELKAQSFGVTAVSGAAQAADVIVLAVPWSA